MEPKPISSSSSNRPIWTLVTVIIVSIGLFASFIVLGNRYQGPNMMRKNAGILSALEVSELVGTDTYHPSSRTPAHDLLTAMMDTFGVPVGNSLGVRPASPAQRTPVIHPVEPVPTGVVSQKPTTIGHRHAEHKLALGWIPSGSSTAGTIQLIQQNPGIDVISPTWYQVASGDGSIHSYVQSGVVTYAHHHGIKVWAMVDNQYSATLAHQLLSNQAAENRFVHLLVSGAVQNHLDGINLDFENMHTADQAAYTAMVGMLHQQLALHHMTLSVDITPDIVFLRDTDVYFHAGLAANSDYVIVMAYDEHWRTDSTPGPVADIPWVTTAVDDLLNTGVPARKVVLGVPFYTYFWHVFSDGTVQADAYGTSDVPSILQSHQAKASFDSQLQLGYAKYPKPDGYEEVWFETKKTVQDQAKLVKDLGLSGVAVWSLSFSTPSSWSLLMHALQN